MKDYLVGFSIAVIAALILFFFYIVPERDKMERKIEASYQKGYDDCYNDIDTVFIPGDTVEVITEKKIFIEKPAIVEKKDSISLVASSVDTTIALNKHDIRVQATVGITCKENYDPIAEWFINLTHKDYDPLPDTVIVKVPKLINIVEKETNWFYIFLSFITGGGIMALLALL